MTTRRINPDRFNSREMHHDAVVYLLRLCADLIRLHDANQPLRADASRLDEWSTHRADLEQCETPLIRYSQHGQFHEGDAPKHGELLLAANGLMIELKLRNVGETVSEIRISELENIRSLAMHVDCRKRVVFY